MMSQQPPAKQVPLVLSSGKPSPKAMVFQKTIKKERVMNREGQIHLTENRSMFQDAGAYTDEASAITPCLQKNIGVRPLIVLLSLVAYVFAFIFFLYYAGGGMATSAIIPSLARGRLRCICSW